MVVVDVTLFWCFCWNDIAVYSSLPLLWQKTLALTSFFLLVLNYYQAPFLYGCFPLWVFHAPYVLCLLVQGAGPADCTTGTCIQQRKSVWAHSISQRVRLLCTGHKVASVYWRSQGEDFFFYYYYSQWDVGPHRFHHISLPIATQCVWVSSLLLHYVPVYSHPFLKNIDISQRSSTSSRLLSNWFHPL